MLAAAGFAFFPIAFLLGYGARHGEAQALEEAVTEGELVLSALRKPQSSVAQQCFNVQGGVRPANGLPEA